MKKMKLSEITSEKEWNRNMPITLEEDSVEFKLITRKPIVSSEEELLLNNRAKSAKLRIIERKQEEER